MDQLAEAKGEDHEIDAAEPAGWDPTSSATPMPIAAATATTAGSGICSQSSGHGVIGADAEEGGVASEIARRPGELAPRLASTAYSAKVDSEARDSSR